MENEKLVERAEPTPKEGQLAVAINLEWFAQFVRGVLDTRQFGTLRILDDDDPDTPSVQTIDSDPGSFTRTTSRPSKIFTRS